MTQKYYTERLLPVYIHAIQEAQMHDLKLQVFQEDNDLSYGTRKPGLVHHLKEANWIDTLIHPAQSPDLNPIEACWNILKLRVRRYTQRSIKELKEVLQDEWSKITMSEVRTYIAEMPDRYKRLVESGGKPIKSNLW